MHQFTGTLEEVNVLVANSQISLKKGKVDTAIRMLGNIPFSSPAYPRAQMVKADIHLKVRAAEGGSGAVGVGAHQGVRDSSRGRQLAWPCHACSRSCVGTLRQRCPRTLVRCLSLCPYPLPTHSPPTPTSHYRALRRAQVPP
jgi:hypothetical protein